MREPAELTPEGVSSRTFSTVGRRGYDRAEVSAFLADVADALRSAREYAERASSRPSFDELGAEAAALLRNANEGAEALRARTEKEVREMRREAEEETSELRRKSEEEASAIIASATEEAERRVREAELVARRFSNVTKRQCDQMVAEAQARAERLDNYEREMRQRISDMEAVFQAFRAEMEASVANTADIARDAEAKDEISIVETPDEGGEAGPKVVGVQPKPIFDNESVSR